MIFSSLILSSFLVSAMENSGRAYPTITGRTGTLRTFSSTPNEIDHFAVSLMGSFMSDEPFIDAKKHSRTSLRVNGNYTFDWGIPVEIFSGFGFTFNENSTNRSSTTLTSYFENTDIGARVGFPTGSDSFFVGTSGFVRLFSGTQSLRNSSGGSTRRSGPFVSGELAVAATWDMSKQLKEFPFRTHLNMGYRLPNANLTGPTQAFNKFALDAFKFQAITGSFSVEAAYRYLVPFVEAWGEYAIGASGVAFKDNRRKVSVGVKATPIPVISIMAAADIGLGGIGTARTEGIPRNPPWELWFGVSFAVDGKTLTPSSGSIRGSALDEETGLPLESVKVTVASESQRPQQTDLSGFYEFRNLSNGDYNVVFSKAGYEPLSRRASIRDGRDALLEARLKKVGPKYGGLNAQLVDKDSQQPISKAYVTATGLDSALSTDTEGRFRVAKIPEGRQTLRVEAEGYVGQDFAVDVKPDQILDQKFMLTKAAPSTGSCAGMVKNQDGTPLTAVFTSETGAVKPFGTDPLTGEYQITLPIGAHTFKVQAENYLPQIIECDVVAGQKTDKSIMLEKPKEAVVIDDKIILPDAIYFEFGSSKIKEDSFPILDQVASLLKENAGFDLLRVEGHTDSVGSEAFNQDLSQKRAQSVRVHLSKKGVPAKKLISKGFGKSKPIATNTTEEGRAENRRVEFNLDRGK